MVCCSCTIVQIFVATRQQQEKALLSIRECKIDDPRINQQLLKFLHPNHVLQRIAFLALMSLDFLPNELFGLVCDIMKERYRRCIKSDRETQKHAESKQTGTNTTYSEHIQTGS